MIGNAVESHERYGHTLMKGVYGKLLPNMEVQAAGKPTYSTKMGAKGTISGLGLGKMVSLDLDDVSDLFAKVDVATAGESSGMYDEEAIYKDMEMDELAVAGADLDVVELEDGSVAVIGCRKAEKKRQLSGKPAPVTFPSSVPSKLGSTVLPLMGMGALSQKNYDEVADRLSKVEVAAAGQTSGGAEDEEALMGQFDTVEHQADGGVLKVALLGESVAVSGFVGKGETFVIPEAINGRPVTVIGPRSFAYLSGLKHVIIPPTVKRIGNFAFMRSGLEEVDIPASVEEIGQKAFSMCKDLQHVTMYEGMRVIEEEAFCGSAVQELTVPSTVYEIGYNAFHKTELTFSGDAPTFAIAPGSKFMLLDPQGGLYRIYDDGMLFLEMLGPGPQHYDVLDGTLLVSKKAFYDHERIESVVLPEGLVAVRSEAFKRCTNLASLHLPSTLTRVEPLIVDGTCIRHLDIPASLVDLEPTGFRNSSCDRVCRPPSYERITVNPENKVFYIMDDMLCARRPDAGGDEVIQYFGHRTEVVIPNSIETVGPSAFEGVEGVRTLVLHENVNRFGLNAFSFTRDVVNLIVYRDGEEYFLRVPNSPGGIRALRWVFNDGSLDIGRMYYLIDEAIAGHEDRVARGQLILNRYENPIFLDSRIKIRFETALKSGIDKTVLAFAQARFLKGFDLLEQLELINDDNIEEFIKLLTENGEVLAVNHLLTMRRGTTENYAMDFDL